MSAITPPSFLDDGVSISNRLPKGLDTQRVARWVSHGTFSDTSAYTGSFVDDDEDMVLRGGGLSDRQSGYEKQEVRKKGGEQIWNENTKKAVSGDVRRHVDKVRDLRGKVQVRKVKSSEKIEIEKEKERVLVPMPRRWETFVIKGKDGRVVVVVDGEGEFDSGPNEVHDINKQHGRYWVQAASTVEPSSPFPMVPSTVLPPPDQYMGTSGLGEGAKRGHEKDEWNHMMSSPRPLSPIPESEDEDGSSTSRESTRSPTDFMAAVTSWKSNPQTSTRSIRSSSESMNEDGSWVSPSKLPHPFTWAASPSNSHKRRSRESQAEDNPEWTDSESPSLQQDAFNGTARFASEASWDEFERPKTLSDVSIAGSNSIRSSLLENVRSHHDAAMSRRRGTSREEIRVDNQHGWEHGSSGRSNGRYASSSDVDNATYRNANWGETPARVA